MTILYIRTSAYALLAISAIHAVYSGLRPDVLVGSVALAAAAGAALLVSLSEPGRAWLQRPVVRVAWFVLAGLGILAHLVS